MAIHNIKSVHVFYMTARALNVTRAARELRVSQSSISYHIKKLESQLGVSLFRRTARGLELTDAGSLLAEHVESGFGLIDDGLSKLSHRADTVKFAILPMFASRWLSSRLGSLFEYHPNLQLSILHHNNNYAGMLDPGKFADIGIQWGQGSWDNFKATQLWAEQLVVVCSPDYLAKHPIRQPGDILDCTLIHVDDTRMWDEWLNESGLQPSPNQPQMLLEDRHFQLSSTINGLGVSLFASWLVQNELEKGDLVNPFSHTFNTSFGYYLITPTDSPARKITQQFHHWLLSLCS